MIAEIQRRFSAKKKRRTEQVDPDQRARDKIPNAKAALESSGDVWTWTEIDAETKLIISWYVGDRDHGDAYAFISDLRARLANKVQLLTDGHKAYLSAVREVDLDADCAMLVKIYGKDMSGPGRYSPPACIGTKTRTIRGNSDPAHINTSYAERQHLTMQMQMRRFTRLTNAFSKKVENHCHALSLYFVWYNFVRMHKTLRMSPAMAAGISDRPWSMEDVVELIDAAAPPATKRGPYKKRDAA